MNEQSNRMVIITEEFKGDVLILRMSGRLDAISSSDVEKRVFDFVNEGRTKLLIDFNGVDYLSSAGMRTLLSVAKKLKSLSGRLVLFGINSTVMEILKMAGFDHVLEIVGSQEEGLRKF